MEIRAIELISQTTAPTQTLRMIDLGIESTLLNICTKFLSSTQITFIDLTPLSGIRYIPKSFLHACISLSYIDLSPLYNVTEIDGQFLAESGLTYVNLLPLASVRKIGNSFLASTPIKHIDLSPLVNLVEVGDFFLDSCRRLASIHADGLARLNTVGVSFLGNIDIEIFESDMRPVNIGAFFMAQSRVVRVIVDWSAVRGIGPMFFMGCRNLRMLNLSELPASVMGGISPFDGCIRLKWTGHDRIRPARQEKLSPFASETTTTKSRK